MTCIYCGAPVGFGTTRCNTETCYLRAIGEREARILELEAIAVAADALRREVLIIDDSGYLQGYVADLDRALEPYWARSPQRLGDGEGEKK